MAKLSGRHRDFPHTPAPIHTSPPPLLTSCIRVVHSIRFSINILEYFFPFIYFFSLIGTPFRWLSLLLFLFFQCFKSSHFSNSFPLLMTFQRVSHPIFHVLFQSSDESFLQSNPLGEFIISTTELSILNLFIWAFSTTTYF